MNYLIVYFQSKKFFFLYFILVKNENLYLSNYLDIIYNLNFI